MQTCQTDGCHCVQIITKFLWIADVNIHLIDVTVLIITKSLQFPSDPSWSCVKSFWKMCLLFQFFLVFLIISTFHYFPWLVRVGVLSVLHWLLLCALLLFPHCLSIHAGSVGQYGLWVCCVCHLLVIFGCLLPWVLFCWYWSGLHLPFYPGYYMSHLCCLYFVPSALVVICSMPHHNFMHASDCALLQQLYDDHTPWHIQSSLQMFSNISQIKCVLISRIILLGSSDSENIILHAVIRLSVLNPWPALWLGICCGNLQYKENACY